MKKLYLSVIALLFAAVAAQSQTNIQFTSINVTDEGAIQLRWSSQSNELYEIDEADSLNSTNVTWNMLYDGYFPCRRPTGGDVFPTNGSLVSPPASILTQIS